MRTRFISCVTLSTAMALSAAYLMPTPDDQTKNGGEPLSLARIAAALKDVDHVEVKGWSDTKGAIEKSLDSPKELSAFTEKMPLAEPRRAHGIPPFEFSWTVTFKKGTKEAAVFRFTRPGYILWTCDGRELNAILGKDGEEYVTRWFDRLGIREPELERSEAAKARAEALARWEKILAEFPAPCRETWKRPVVRKNPIPIHEGSPDDFHEKADEIARLAGGTEKAVKCVFRAGGVVWRSWKMHDAVDSIFERIVAQASGEQLRAALEASQNDEVALLGASKVILANFGDPKNYSRLPEPTRYYWIGKLYEVMSRKATEGACHRATFVAAKAQAKSAIPTMRLLFAGERRPLVEEFDKPRDEDPTLRGATAVGLAMLDDKEAIGGLRKALDSNKSRPDGIAFEIGLSLLVGEPELGRRHFGTDSYDLALYAIAAAEHVGGRRGIDLLVAHGLDTSCRQVQEAHAAINRLLQKSAPVLARDFMAIKEWNNIPKWWTTKRDQFPSGNGSKK